MRAPWEALKESLVRSVGTLGAQEHFNEIRARQRSLQRFSDAGQLITFLNAGDGDLDEKDAIHAALVEAAQEGGTDAETAITLIWLGLWPALDAIYRRRQRDFFGEPEALVSEIGAKLSATIQRADLDRIHRVAATLVRNVERDVREALKRKWADENRRADLPEDWDHDPDDDEWTGQEGPRSALC